MPYCQLDPYEQTSMKFQSKYMYMFFNDWNTFENVVCKILAILLKPQCVNAMNTAVEFFTLKELMKKFLDFLNCQLFPLTHQSYSSLPTVCLDSFIFHSPTGCLDSLVLLSPTGCFNWARDSDANWRDVGAATSGCCYWQDAHHGRNISCEWKERSLYLNMYCTRQLPSNIWYKLHQIPKLKCFSSRLAVVFAQSIEARCWVENKDVVGAAPTGDTPTTSEWSTILLPTMVQLIL